MVPLIDMSHSEILASLNFNNKKMLSPGLENNPTLKCGSRNFSTESYMSRLLEKYQINIWVYGYSPIQGDKVQILVKSTGQIFPVVLHLFWRVSPGFENTHTFKCWSGIFQQSWQIWLCWKIDRTTFQWMVVLQSTKVEYLKGL